MRKVSTVNFRQATDEDMHLPDVDYTTITAIATCPTWGIVRYMHHKAMSSSSRAMALEAGQACHDVFAAVRLWELGVTMGFREHMLHHGPKLFPGTRWDNMMQAWERNADEIERMQQINFCLEALYTSGFVDDPDDKRRTMANLEEACIAYIDRYPFGKHPVWIRDESDPTSDVGIEIPFNFVVTFELEDGSTHEYRFVGRMDGLHWYNKDKTRLRVHENKTGARLNDAWALSFVMSHQVTGYSLAASLFTELPVNDGVVHGLAIPLPRTYDFGGVVTEPFTRKAHAFADWAQWIWALLEIFEQYKDTPTEAPKFTHSCNRYFRPCSFIPMCGEEPDERVNVFNEMVIDRWSPLDD